MSKNPQPHKEQNTVELLGTASTLTPTIKFNSASRIQMASIQAGQAIIPASSELPRMLNGLEDQMGEYTFGVSAPEDLSVVAVLEKYNKGVGANSIKTNPLITVIYQARETGEFGVFHIESYQNQLERVHEIFSFKYKFTPKCLSLQPGMCLVKGEKLSYSPNITSEGLYATGISANVAYMSTPPTIEDGFEVSEEFLAKAQPIATASKIAEFGKKYYPVNLYGTPGGAYVPFPEIGGRIRPDGLVFALRPYDDQLGGLDMTAASLTKPDLIHDRLTYGTPNAKVFDVNAHTTTNEGNKSTNTPRGMETTAEKYANQNSDYHARILAIYEKIRSETRGSFKLKPQLQTLISVALGDKPNQSVRRLERTNPRKNTVQKTWRASPLDEWRVEVMYEYKFPMGKGAKISNRQGGKGVVCSVRKREELPVDDFGNRVDIVIYGKGAVARLNPGQFYEQFINAASRDVSLDIREMCAKRDREGAWNHLLNYYAIVSPKILEHIDPSNIAERDEMLDSVLDNGIYLYIPADDPNLTIDSYDRVMAYRPPNKSQLTYTNVCGEVIRTESEILIGEEDFIILDKLDHKPMAVSGVLRQHHGLPAVQTRSTKSAFPANTNAPRVLGEAECRSASSVMGGEALANIVSVATSPDAHRAAVRAIYNAEKPTDIDKLVDRNKFPNRSRRSAAFVHHLTEVAGIQIKDI